MILEIEVVNDKDSNFIQVRIGSAVVLVKASDLEAAQPRPVAAPPPPPPPPPQAEPSL